MEKLYRKVLLNLREGIWKIHFHKVPGLIVKTITLHLIKNENESVRRDGRSCSDGKVFEK